MNTEFALGSALYFVPRWDNSLASYVRVTRIHSALKCPLLTLGNQLVIAPKLKASGMVARDKAGSFWVSKEAFESSRSWLGWAWKLKPSGAAFSKIPLCNGGMMSPALKNWPAIKSSGAGSAA